MTPLKPRASSKNILSMGHSTRQHPRVTPAISKAHEAKSCAGKKITLLYLSLNQPLEEIKAVTIALQGQDPTRGSILPTQLFCFQKTPVRRDAL